MAEEEIECTDGGIECAECGETSSDIGTCTNCGAENCGSK